MNHTANSVHIQQRFIQTQQIASNCQSTFNLLTSDILFNEVEKRLPEHRERLFPPTETLAMFITQALWEQWGRTSLTLCFKYNNTL